MREIPLVLWLIIAHSPIAESISPNDPWNIKLDKLASLDFRKVKRENAMYSLYNYIIKPLELEYLYPQFNDTTSWTEYDFGASPQVLVIGPYSVGKTTLIDSLIKGDCPGINIGPEPTTDKFIIYRYGDSNQIVPGNALIVSDRNAYGELTGFGAAFLNQLIAVNCSQSLLERVTIVDTPGILSGIKQSRGREYDFDAVSEWFASRSDLIIIMFDAHKLDVSDEMAHIIKNLMPHRNKFRVLLNKAQEEPIENVLRIYGALMWNLAKIFDSPEVVKVEIGNFDFEASIKRHELSHVFRESRRKIETEIRELHTKNHLRKLEDLVQRARRVKVHVLILDRIRKYLESESSMFSRMTVEKAVSLLTTTKIKTLFRQVEYEFAIKSPADFPDLTSFYIELELEMEKIIQLETKDILDKIDCIDFIITKSLPDLYKG